MVIFPQYPVMPGVLILEALAQTAGVLELSKPENKGKLVFYAGMDKVKFKKQVVPGDQLVMTATLFKRRGTIAVVEAKAEVDGKLAASGTLTFAIGTKEVLHVSKNFNCQPWVRLRFALSELRVNWALRPWRFIQLLIKEALHTLLADEAIVSDLVRRQNLISISMQFYLLRS